MTNQTEDNMNLHPLKSRPKPIDNDMVKLLRLVDTIPFVSQLERCELSIDRVAPVYFENKGLIWRLMNGGCVTTAKELAKVFKPKENTPSIIFMTGNQTPEYVMIHSTEGPNSSKDYRVSTFVHDYTSGLRNIPVTHVMPKVLANNYLRSVEDSKQ